MTTTVPAASTFVHKPSTQHFKLSELPRNWTKAELKMIFFWWRRRCCIYMNIHTYTYIALNTARAVRNWIFITTTMVLHAHEPSTHHWTLSELWDSEFSDEGGAVLHEPSTQHRALSEVSETEVPWRRRQCCMYINHPPIPEHCQSCQKLNFFLRRRRCCINMNHLPALNTDRAVRNWIFLMATLLHMLVHTHAAVAAPSISDSVQF